MNINSPSEQHAFSYDIKVLSYALGLHHADAALFLTATLTGLTGPSSGISTFGGRGIPVGINLIALGAPEHRLQRVADHLVAPVLHPQDWLRQAAARSNRAITEAFTAGPADLKGWLAFFQGERTPFTPHMIKQFDAIQQDVTGGDGLIGGWDQPEAMGMTGGVTDRGPEAMMQQRVPGLRQRPSFALTVGDPTVLAKMLDEVADRHALLLDLDGHLLCGTMERSAKERAALRTLAQEIAGCDVQGKPAHPGQGYGTVERARVRLLSAMPSARLAEILGHPEAAEHALLRHTVLWQPQWQPVKLLVEGNTDNMQQHYRQVVEQIINDRAGRRGTIVKLYGEEGRALEELDVEMVAALDQCPSSVQPFLGVFSSMVYRVFWALNLLNRKDEPSCVPATRATVLHALRQHVAAIEGALNEAQHQKVAKIAKRVLSVLTDRGPCNVRTLQRAIYKAKASEIEQALEHLVGIQKVIYRRNSRSYDVPGESVMDEAGPASPLDETRSHVHV